MSDDNAIWSDDAWSLQHAIKLTFLISPFHCHCSQFEEKFEEINGVDVASKFPPSPEVNKVNKDQSTVVPEDKGKEIEVQRQDGEGPSSDLNNNHDFVSGIMKIVPSDVAVSITSVCGIFVFCICKLLGKSVSYVQSTKIWRVLAFKIYKLLHVFCCEGSSVVSDLRKKTLELIWNCDIFLQSDADYWLLSDADVSITDMWRTERILSRHLSLHFIHYSYTYTHTNTSKEKGFGSSIIFFCNFLDIFTAGVEWNELEALQEEYCMAREQSTTPNHASNIGEVPSASNPTVGWSLKRIYFEPEEKVVFFLQLRTYDIHPDLRGWIEGC